MKAHYIKVRHILSVIAIITIGIIGIELLLYKLFFSLKFNLKEILGILLTSVTMIVLTSIYLYFEYIGWRHNFWRMINFNSLIKFPPDMRGRWEGSLYRYKDDVKHDYAIEIEQTMTKISVRTYSPSGHMSKSVLDEIASDLQLGRNFYLCFLWDGTGSKMPYQQEESGRFYGYTILRLIETDNVKKLEGEYFTGRETKGILKLEWKGDKLKKEF